MHKCLLILSLITNLISADIGELTYLEKIEYSNHEIEEGIILLNIYLCTSNKDIVELKIYFCDEEGNKIKKEFYSSALTISKRKQTIAKIPLTIKEKMNLNITLFSYNKQEEFENIFFPIYPKENNYCNLNEKKICSSNSPVFVVYQNNKLYEEYETISLLNDNKIIYSFNNLIPLNKIRIYSNLHNEEGYVTLYTKDDIGLQDDYIPLNVYFSDKILEFKIASKYYVDAKNGKVYEQYKNNTILDNEIILPYEDKKYVFKIKLEDSFYSFNIVEFTFNVQVKGGLIGNCKKSKYCIRNSYL